MMILSHRGYWKESHEKNTTTAFTRSFQLDFGTETDIRDHHGELVISHDMSLGHEMRLSELMCLLQEKQLPLALNIKADGLASALQSVMKQHAYNDWFVFDMSIPDMRAHIACGNPVFARISEVEPYPVYLDKIQGIWLDAFYRDGWQLEQITSWLMQDKRVCLVSPELHGRDHHALWQGLRDAPFCNNQNLMLCTDYPEEAQQFFRN